MKRILLKLWSFILRMTNKIDGAVEKIIPVATNVVQAIKLAVENPLFEITTTVVKNIIPGQTDDIIIDRAVVLARLYIPRIALQLNIINSITDIEDPREQLQIIFAKLQNVKGEKWQKFCSQLAQQIVIDMADGKITWGEAGVYVELYYKTYIKK
jgi:hypothetical protein